MANTPFTNKEINDFKLEAYRIGCEARENKETLIVMSNPTYVEFSNKHGLSVHQSGDIDTDIAVTRAFNMGAFNE